TNVWAAGHANDDVIGGETQGRKPLIKIVQQVGQITLALCKRETAGRQRHTRHRIATQSRPWYEQPGFARDAFYLSLLACRYVGDDEVLVRRDPELTLVQLADAPR